MKHYFFSIFILNTLFYDTIYTGDIMQKILVVEDDQLIQRSLKEALELKDYEVIQAFNVKQTLEIMNSSIDLIIMDIQLPDGNGISLCQHIQRN